MNNPKIMAKKRTALTFIRYTDCCRLLLFEDRNLVEFPVCHLFSDDRMTD